MNLALVALAVLALCAPSTLSDPGKTGSHEAFLREVRSAEARALQSALDAYEAHLREHPADVVAAVEQCKLITAVMSAREDREDDEVDERQGLSHADCLKTLEQRFPDSALALSYRIDSTWGKDASALAEQALSNPRITWTDAERGQDWIAVLASRCRPYYRPASLVGVADGRFQVDDPQAPSSPEREGGFPRAKARNDSIGNRPRGDRGLR